MTNILFKNYCTVFYWKQYASTQVFFYILFIQQFRNVFWFYNSSLFSKVKPFHLGWWSRQDFSTLFFSFSNFQSNWLILMAPVGHSSIRKCRKNDTIFPSKWEYWSGGGVLILLVLYPDVFRDGDAAMVAIVVESFASFRGHHRMESRSVRTRRSGMFPYGSPQGF